MLKNGAAIIDIGGESTRPGSKTVHKEKEWKRIKNTIIKLKNLLKGIEIISLEGNLLRLAMDHRISRNEFIKFYIGNEINPNLKKFLDTNDAWKQFFNRNKNEFKNIRDRLVEI